MESLGLASPNGPPSTTYTYDAFGNPTASGASSSYPFLFQGLEHETGDAPGVYYLSNGEYYASQIERELQQVGAVRLVGPGLSGGTHHRRSHHASGGGGHRVRFVANDGELGGGGGSGGQGSTSAMGTVTPA